MMSITPSLAPQLLCVCVCVFFGLVCFGSLLPCLDLSILCYAASAVRVHLSSLCIVELEFDKVNALHFCGQRSCESMYFLVAKPPNVLIFPRIVERGSGCGRGSRGALDGLVIRSFDVIDAVTLIWRWVGATKRRGKASQQVFLHILKYKLR